VELQRLTWNAEVNWPRLLIGMLMTLIVSLSIHVVMLQVLGIPFPDFAGVSAWASFLNAWFAMLALIIFCSLARPRLARFSAITQCVAVFVLYAMLKESARSIVMNGVVTTGWGYDVLAGVPGLVSSFVLASLVVITTPKLRGIWPKVAGAAAIAAVLIFVVRPLIQSGFAPVLKAAAPLDHAEVYPFPYGWQALIPAYLTYAEPVIACMLLAVLVWQGLSTKPGIRMLQFVALVLLVKGMLFPTFVYSFYSRARLPLAMLSQSQFFLETLALAILTALVWQFSGNSRPAVSQPGVFAARGN